MQIPWIFVSMENARYNTWTLHKSKSNLKYFYTATSSNETAVKKLPLLIYWNYSSRSTDILPHLSYRKCRANRTRNSKEATASYLFLSLLYFSLIGKLIYTPELSPSAYFLQENSFFSLLFSFAMRTENSKGAIFLLDNAISLIKILVTLYFKHLSLNTLNGLVYTHICSLLNMDCSEWDFQPELSHVSL